MAIYKGDKKIIALYKGDKKIIKRYKGTQVVYNYIPEDTGTTTYADDALAFEFTGTSLTYKLNNKTYTATTSPTIVNLSDLGYNANTSSMFYNLFYNQTNLTKVLHFPKITGTNNLGFGLFWDCKNVEYIDLSNIGNLNDLHLQFRNCTSLKNLILDNVDLSNSDYANYNNTFDNVPNDIQISMNDCNCESIVTIKQALNDAGIVTYNNNVVTNNNCTFEPYETIEYNVNFYNIDERETYNRELKADSVYMIETICNEDGIITLTESNITKEVSYEYEQFEEYGESKIKCTIYYKEKNIYEITYKGKLPEKIDGIPLSCDTDKTIPMQKFYINWYEGIDSPGYHYITFSTSPNKDGDCGNCGWDEINICPSDNSYQKPNGFSGMISDLPMENGYYVLDMGETVYFKCGERNALFDHVFYCESVEPVKPVKQSYAMPITCDTDKTIPMQIFSISGLLKEIDYMLKVKFSDQQDGYGDCNDCNGNAYAYIDVSNNEYQRPDGKRGMISDLPMEGDYLILDMGKPVYYMCSEGNIDEVNSIYGDIVLSGTESSIISNNTVSYQCIFDDILTVSSYQINDDIIAIHKEDCQHMEGNYYMYTKKYDEPITRFRFLGGNVTEIYAIPNATNMKDISFMFEGCLKLKSINLAGINVSNATNANYIFAGLENLGSGEPELVIDVSGWRGPSYMTATNMFTDSTNLKTLKLGTVGSGEYAWWLQQIRNAKLENQVKIEYTIIK
jgi:hypothetical protein